MRIVYVKTRVFWMWAALSVLLALTLLFQTFLLWQADRGDLNHDGHVDVSDLARMAKHYGHKD